MKQFECEKPKDCVDVASNALSVPTLSHSSIVGSLPSTYCPPSLIVSTRSMTLLQLLTFNQNPLDFSKFATPQHHNGATSVIVNHTTQYFNPFSLARYGFAWLALLGCACRCRQSGNFTLKILDFLTSQSTLDKSPAHSSSQ